MRTASHIVAWIALTFLIGFGLPLFICMPLWADVTHYDMAARNLLQGGVAYRDIFDTNLPGMVWLHVIIRSVVGWSSEAMRFVDVVIFAGIIGLLIAELRDRDIPIRGRVWFAGVMSGCYLYSWEMVHCQRDVWLLIPALIAMRMRPSVWAGLIWGIGVWIKPHIIVPALFVYLIRKPPRRTGQLIVGGLIAGALGMAWMFGSGAWPHFVEVMRTWNVGGYYDRNDRPDGFGQWVMEPFRMFPPWTLLHALAIPLAINDIVRRRSTLSGLYLGFLIQATFMQKGHIYVFMPPLLLAFAVISANRIALGPIALGWFTFTAMILLTPIAGWLKEVRPITVSLMLEPHECERMEQWKSWPRCWSEGASPELMNRVGRMSDFTTSTDWVQLYQIAEFLRSRNLTDGELLCEGNTAHPLYLMLNLRPATRYMHVGTIRYYFPARRDALDRELRASGCRYIVSDCRVWGLTIEQGNEEIKDDPLALPPDFPEWERELFPWNVKVTHRVGRYYVHQMNE